MAATTKVCRCEKARLQQLGCRAKVPNISGRADRSHLANPSFISALAETVAVEPEQCLSQLITEPCGLIYTQTLQASEVMAGSPIDNPKDNL